MLVIKDDGSAVCETNGFSDDLCSKFFSLYKEEKLCDITLVVGDVTFGAHQLILGLSSDFFRAMFAANLDEMKDQRANFSAFEPKAFRLVIEYCYTGCLEIRDETVEDILTISHGLMLEPVTEFCCDYLIHHLDPGNCIGIQALADTHHCQRLNSAATDFILNNFKEILEHNEFCKLSIDQVTPLISSNLLYVHSEAVVLSAVIKWLTHDLEARKEHIFQLLSLVRLALVPKNDIFDGILEDPMFSDDARCVKIAVEALKFQDFPQKRGKLKNSQTKARYPTLGSLYVASSDIGYVFDPQKESWVEFPELSRKTPGSSMLIHLGFIYSLGGENDLRSTPSCQAMCMKHKIWVNRPTMRNPRREFGAAVLNNNLYVSGGIGPSGSMKSCERECTGWKHIAAMAKGRAQHSLAALDDRLYAIGGTSEGVIGGFKYKRSGEYYNPQKNLWFPIACMGTPRGNFGLVSCNGFLYAVGGTIGSETGIIPPPTSSVERYNPACNRWEEVASLVMPCHSAGVVFWDEKIYCIGGVTTDCVALQMVQIYDPQTDQWTEGVPLPETIREPMVFVHAEHMNNKEDEESCTLLSYSTGVK